MNQFPNDENVPGASAPLLSPNQAVDPTQDQQTVDPTTNQPIPVSRRKRRAEAPSEKSAPRPRGRPPLGDKATRPARVPGRGRGRPPLSALLGSGFDPRVVSSVPSSLPLPLPQPDPTQDQAVDPTQDQPALTPIDPTQDQPALTLALTPIDPTQDQPDPTQAQPPEVFYGPDPDPTLVPCNEKWVLECAVRKHKFDLLEGTYILVDGSKWEREPIVFCSGDKVFNKRVVIPSVLKQSMEHFKQSNDGSYPFSPREVEAVLTLYPEYDPTIILPNLPSTFKGVFKYDEHGLILMDLSGDLSDTDPRKDQPVFFYLNSFRNLELTGVTAADLKRYNSEKIQVAYDGSWTNILDCLPNGYIISCLTGQFVGYIENYDPDKDDYNLTQDLENHTEFILSSSIFDALKGEYLREYLTAPDLDSSVKELLYALGISESSITHFDKQKLEDDLSMFKHLAVLNTLPPVEELYHASGQQSSSEDPDPTSDQSSSEDEEEEERSALIDLSPDQPLSSLSGAFSFSQPTQSVPTQSVVVGNSVEVLSEIFSDQLKLKKENSSGIQLYRFVFRWTLNENSSDEGETSEYVLQALKKATSPVEKVGLKYYAYQLEIGEKTGRKHWQGYFKVQKKQRIRKMLEYLGPYMNGVYLAAAQSASVPLALMSPDPYPPQGGDVDYF